VCLTVLPFKGDSVSDQDPDKQDNQDQDDDFGSDGNDQVDELAVNFTRETMPIAANNLTRAQLFQILPRHMSQYKLAFVKSCINEANCNRKMDPVFEAQ
jgi:hypothetical protein